MKSKKMNSDLLAMLFALAVIFLFALIVVLTGRMRDTGMTFSSREMELIDSADTLMRVLTVDNPDDLVVLRDSTMDFSDADIASDLFRKLAGLMVSTMTDPSQDGVGIAAPQVGLSRRLAVVQRFDKTGEPVEVYPNLRIEKLYGEMQPGREGCLSIPGFYGIVRRYPHVVISYKDISTLEYVRDTVSGFTAVIFQHEADHLDGILYTDRTAEVFPEDTLTVSE